MRKALITVELNPGEASRLFQSLEGSFSGWERVCHSPNEIEPDWREIAFGVNNGGLRDLLQGLLLKRLFDKTDYETIVYLDPNLRCELASIETNLNSFETVLIAQQPSGFNPRVVCFNRTQGVISFLNWWHQRIEESGYHGARQWLSQIPMFVSSIRVEHELPLRSESPICAEEDYQVFTYIDGIPIPFEDRTRYALLTPLQRRYFGDPYHSREKIQRITHIEATPIRVETVEKAAQQMARSAIQIQQRYEHMLQTPSWVIGRAITWPIRKARNQIKSKELLGRIPTRVRDWEWVKRYF